MSSLFILIGPPADNRDGQKLVPASSYFRKLLVRFVSVMFDMLSIIPSGVNALVVFCQNYFWSNILLFLSSPPPKLFIFNPEFLNSLMLFIQRLKLPNDMLSTKMFCPLYSHVHQISFESRLVHRKKI